MSKDFVPALGRPEFTANYDNVVAVMTRERRWRTALLRELAAKGGELILDFGCGTASQAILIKQAAPSARVIGIDPDPDVLEIARAKAAAADVDIAFVRAMGDTAHDHIKFPADAAISSLVLHQCPLDMKRAILRSMFNCLKPKGRLVIADFGLQRTPLMAMLFRQVRLVDGFENTKANKDGMLPALIAEAGMIDVQETKVIQTPTGSISLYKAIKP